MNIDTRYSLAVIVLVLLGASCAGEPQQAGQAVAVQPTRVSAAASAALTAASMPANDSPIKCAYVVPNGTMIRELVCITASKKVFSLAPKIAAIAKDSDPLECQSSAVTGTMMPKWSCMTASEIANYEARLQLIQGAQSSSGGY
jgi:hypothetical protein